MALIYYPIKNPLVPALADILSEKDALAFIKEHAKPGTKAYLYGEMSCNLLATFEVQNEMSVAAATELVNRFEEAILERRSSMQVSKGKVTVDVAKDERYQEKRATVISLIVDAMRSKG